MNQHHAGEITLTRPAAPGELAHATRTRPLAVNHDATRFMAVVHAKTPAGHCTACAVGSAKRCPST
ncbi:hypothetical protein ACIHCV_38540 [Streptomyces sp. NPDC051956]|uniref:hypothetical protein n=1 Tax=Streptomyces sp. NPDC051956 TaxID=3365677 RepID=UPI0037D73715